jgi:membrane associated rhomboid family serine protease
MFRLRSLNRPVNLLGHNFPLVAVLLAAAPLVASVAAAVGGRSGVRLLDQLVLSPRLVFHGDLWRLVTWPLFERDALSLFFVALVVLWCGRDLAYAWGPGRLLGVCLGLGAASGAVTCVVGRLLWADVYNGFYFAPWAIGSALIVAWALLFPHRRILFMFVLPLSGVRIIYATLVLTALVALLNGPAGYVPHFAAIGLAWLYRRGESPRTAWLRLRFRLLDWQRRRGRARLRPVERPGDRPRWYH